MLKTNTYTNFTELPDHSLSFLDNAEKTNFFLGKGWFENFSSNTLTSDSHIHIYCVDEVSDTTQTRAVLFMRSPGGQAGSLSKKVFSGAKSIASMTAHQSIYFAPIIDESYPDREKLIYALIKSICDDDHQWNLIDINFMNRRSQIFHDVTKALNQCGMQVRHYDYVPNMYEDLSGMTFKDFIASRPSMVRKTYMRKSRKLKKSNAVRFELISAGNVEKAIEDYIVIHDNSWKEEEVFPEHDPGVIRKAASSGNLRMGLLYVDDRPVAVQVWLVSSNKATIYKLHYDADYHQQSVGAILTLHMFEHMIDVEHINEVDFGIGDEEAKSLWLKNQRPLCGIVAFNINTTGGVVALSRFTASDMLVHTKQKLKPVLSPIKHQLSHANTTSSKALSEKDCHIR